MLRRPIALAGALALALALPACGGGSGAHGPVPTAPQQPGTPVIGAPLASGSFAYGAQALTGASLVRPAKLGAVHFQALVRLQNADGLAQYAQAVSDPASGSYRQFLTAGQIAQRFGATAADYQAAADYFRSYGLRVGGWNQRLTLSVTGKQADVERAFGTQLGIYQGANGAAIGPVSTPKLAKSVPIVAVQGLVLDQTKANKYRAFVPVPAPRGQGNNFTGGYTPQQVAAAFDYNGAYAAGYTGKGINIGIIATGPVDPGDLNVYKQNFSLGGSGRFIQVAATSAAAAVGGGGPGEGSPTSPTIPPVTAPCRGTLPACNPEDGEAQIDTEQALLAPDANTLFYIAYVPAECGDPNSPGSDGPCDANNPNYAGPQLGISENDDEIQQAISDNNGGGTGPDVLSLSFGGAEQGNKFYFTDANGAYSHSAFGTTEYAALAAEGVATFVSSGDAGAQGCARPLIPKHADDQCVSYPAVDPDVISVGGVTSPLDNAGRFIGPMTGWGFQTNAGAGGSGGGVSQFVPAPAWQTGPGIIGSMRNQPDASLLGDDVTGVATFVNTSFGFSGSGSYGGTSVAAPQMAAMWALVLSACKATASCHGPGGTYRLGNPAPLMYAAYNSPAKYPTTFYDVTFGNSGVVPCLANPGQVGKCPNPQPTPDPGFNAGTGFDQITGIGVPFARHLIQTIVGV